MSSKLNISVRPEKLARFSHTRLSFHVKYASVVFKTLRRPVFQSFICWMLKREKIGEDAVASVKVMAFPFRKENGNVLAGRCNSKGEIHIYPKRLEFCQKLRQRFGRERFLSYIKNRARAALIHELLHVKYSNDEERVRELTKKYFKTFTRHPEAPNVEDDILKMVFKH